MARHLVIDPVSRIEGRARVTIELDDGRRGHLGAGPRDRAAGVRVDLRGAAARRDAGLTARICGICPVSHLLAAARAGDVILGAPPPPAARGIRELVQLAQVVQSHALSFFYLSAPDLVLGHDAPPDRRSILGLAEAAPALARDGVALRAFGQGVIEKVTGQRIHGAFAVPGGVTRPLGAEVRRPSRLASPRRSTRPSGACTGGRARSRGMPRRRRRAGTSRVPSWRWSVPAGGSRSAKAACASSRLPARSSRTGSTRRATPSSSASR